MLTKAIRELLAKQPGAAPGPDRPFEVEKLAAAALMVECARVDGEFTEEEHAVICRAVREAFSLDRLRTLTDAEIRERYQAFRGITAFPDLGGA